jgi:hypothetical protein
MVFLDHTPFAIVSPSLLDTLHTYITHIVSAKTCSNTETTQNSGELGEQPLNVSCFIISYLLSSSDCLLRARFPTDSAEVLIEHRTE